MVGKFDDARPTIRCRALAGARIQVKIESVIDIVETDDSWYGAPNKSKSQRSAL